MPIFRHNTRVRFSIVSLLVILLLPGLAACGDNTPTTAPVAPTTAPAVTTAAAAVATTVVSTTAALATTAAPVAPATTAAPITTTAAPATTAAASVGTASAPLKLNLEGATEVTIDPTLAGILKGASVPGGSAVSDLALTLYSSDNDPVKLAETTDSALTAAGYKFTDLEGKNNTKLTVQGEDAIGVYLKSGAPDYYIITTGAPSLAASSAPPGANAADYQKLIDQFKTKKSVLLALSGTNLYQLIKAAAPTSTVAPTTTKAG
ncbi:MAG: hypothetical protein JWP00_4693 [Chloroflexi bacterium]|nr:hypothetical protein [Chloroflexota bacterium]